MPAYFPDGRALDEKIYPWLVAGIVRRYFPRLKTTKKPLFKIQVFIVSYLVWWLVPTTMALLWIRYIVRQQVADTIYHFALISIVMAISHYLYSLTRKTLSITREKRDKENKLERTLRKIKRVTYYPIVTIIYLFIFNIISVNIITGVSQEISHYSHYNQSTTTAYDKTDNTNKVSVVWNDTRWLIPWIFNKFGYNPFVDVSEQDLSIAGQGAHLRYANLRWANMVGTKLANSDFQYADMKSSNLAGAVLSNANFSYANLTNTNLMFANLRNATFTAANLKNTIFHGADISGAEFMNSKGLVCGQLNAVKKIEGEVILPKEIKRCLDDYLRKKDK